MVHRLDTMKRLNEEAVARGAKTTPQARPTADEVCRMLELMSMHADESDKIMSFIYRMTHVLP